jgi:uncharacterized cupredoxin-like copper-binding protein
VLLAGLSTGNKIGLAVVGGTFIVFALTSALVVPRRRPEFPGRNGLSVFVLVSVAFFVAMLTAVIVFDRESEAKGAGKGAPAGKSLPVSETEFKIAAPSQATAGKVTFVVRNAGKIQHDLVVTGPGLTGATKTPLLASGQTAKLNIVLTAGSYTLYCSVPGHRAAGMQATLTVG